MNIDFAKVDGIVSSALRGASEGNDAPHFVVARLFRTGADESVTVVHGIAALRSDGMVRARTAILASRNRRARGRVSGQIAFHVVAAQPY